MTARNQSFETLIEDSKSLEKFCGELSEKRQLGFDTEFVREKTYYPRLEVFQLNVDGRIAVIDCQAVESLEPLWELLLDPSCEKIVHSGLQDMELIYQESGRLPANVFDTQIAASLLGYGSQCGYGRLLYQVLGKKIAKGETISDWSRRPLHPDQLHYARKDVEYLLALREKLVEKLDRSGRLSWVREECLHLSDPETHEKHSPEQSFQRIKGRSSLDSESLSALRSLAAWREREARKRDLPPGRILRDHILLSIAKSKPDQMEQLRRIRGIHAGDLSRFGESILEAVKSGRETVGDFQEMARESGSKRRLEMEGALKILSAVLRIEAEKSKISPSMVATSDDLREFVSQFRKGDLNGHPLLHGWRKELAGDRLLSVLEGRVALRINPETLDLILEEPDA